MSQFAKVADDIGMMNHRIELIQITKSIDTDFGGEVSDSESTLATVWATFEPKQALSGEDVIGGQKDASMKVNWRIRYRNDVTETMLVKESGKYYNILSVVPDSKRVYLVLESEYLGLNWSKT